MSGFLEFLRTQYTNLPVPQPPANIANGTYIVTGANSGLGLECTKRLFLMGAGRIILTVRSQAKGEAVLANIRNETGRPDAGEVWELDLESLDSVETFSKRLGTLDRLDALIANAGVVATKFRTVGGMESSLVVNVVSTMLLALRALPKLQESARVPGIQPHLVIVSSRTGLDSGMKGSVERLRGNLFDALSTEKGFKPLFQYPMTKLLEIYAVRQLADLVPLSTSGVIINAVSPGLCYSNLDRNAPAIPKLMMAIMRSAVARTSEEGSRTLLHAAFAGPDSHGAYCADCLVKEHAIPTWITDSQGKRTQKRVWDDILMKLASSGHSVDLALIVASQ